MISNRDVINRLRLVLHEIEPINALYKEVNDLIPLKVGFKEKDLDTLSSCLLTDDVKDVIEFFERIDANVRHTKNVIAKYKKRLEPVTGKLHTRMWKKAIE